MKYYATLLLILCIPLFALAQPGTPGGESGGVAPTDDYGNPTQTTTKKPPPKDSGENTGIVYVCTSGAAGECGFGDLMAAVNKVINFGILLALSFSVVVLAIAGGKIMISADNANKRTEAKEMFYKVAWGIFFMLGAFLIVKLIATALLSDAVLQSVPLENIKK